MFFNKKAKQKTQWLDAVQLSSLRIKSAQLQKEQERRDRLEKEYEKREYERSVEKAAIESHFHIVSAKPAPSQRQTYKAILLIEITWKAKAPIDSIMGFEIFDAGSVPYEKSIISIPKGSISPVGDVYSYLYEMEVHYYRGYRQTIKFEVKSYGKYDPSDTSVFNKTIYSFGNSSDGFFDLTSDKLIELFGETRKNKRKEGASISEPWTSKTDMVNSLSGFDDDSKYLFEHSSPVLDKAEVKPDGAIKLIWSPYRKADGYLVFRREATSESGRNFKIMPEKIGGTDGLSVIFTDKNAEEGKDYAYSVKALRYYDDITGERNRAFSMESNQVIARAAAHNSQGRLKDTHPDIDHMEGHKFEHFCADVLKKNGFDKTTVTQDSGDQGIDIIAERDGVKYAFQCKCYSEAVGNHAVQEVYAGKTFYNCHVGIVLTNRDFTPSAIRLAEKNGILLWGRKKLLEMMKNAEMQ